MLTDLGELHSLSESLKRISGQLHEQTRELERAVEGTYASYLSDPRVQLLSKTLAVSRRADLELSRLSQLVLNLHRRLEGHEMAALEREQERLRSSITALKRERHELETLYEIARTLNSTLEFEEVLRLVMDQVISFVGAERGFLALLNEQGELEFKIARTKDARSLERDAFNLGISQSTVNRVVQTRQPILTSDAQEDRDLKEQRSIIENRIRSIMCAPLVVRDRCIGAVYVDSRLNANLFGPQQRDLLFAFCHQAAIAIDNARLFADLQRTLRQVNEDKQYMDNIFASIANGVITTDPEGVITTFNRAAGAILKLDQRAVLGKHYREVLGALPELGLVELLQEALLHHEHGTRVPVAFEGEVAGLGRVNMNFYVTALRDEHGQHIGSALVIDDRTDLKRAQDEARQIKSLFGRYVHPSVVKRLLEDPHSLKLGGETREITVISADLRGYTSLAERLPPEQMMNLLNSYLDLMVEAIWDEGGTLTAFWGDELMAIFNAPLEQADHPLRAVRAAWKMRQAILDYARRHPEVVPVKFGIGVNTGLAIVGNIGSRERIQNYTAIGDTVNVAARLQSKADDNNIYLNASTFYRVRQHVQIDHVGTLQVKNRSEPLEVMRLTGVYSLSGSGRA
ncbi:adenylate/guanylate cyclase domain-containing protein [Thermogemmatispora sp.]|uniref:adenylate/guanylate cyclase domain-containing protein n=1 Tax=Thermogemmatispora sp. TaxID=1968838 RepID=UPI0035E41EF1